MSIPKIIHQTFHSRHDLPDFLKKNIRKLQSMNPDWEYRLYEDADCERFIRENYDAETFKLFRSIHPDYGAARADFFRYLLLYRLGGVYLDIKSGCAVPLNSFLREDDEFLLSHWRHRRDGYHPEFEIASEFQQWHIMARAGHPFLAAVIAGVSENLRHYDPISHGVGKRAVLQMTGPIAYTRAIAPLLECHPYRVFQAEETGVTYSVAPIRHDEIFRKHYSKVTRPLVRFAHVRKDYFSPRIVPLMLIYMNDRFYKFLCKTINDLRK
ncbi:MAG: glycosyltransferase [Roseomonas sp.]|nr:glycosyltransferase [Roseomonas sp.]